MRAVFHVTDGGIVNLDTVAGAFEQSLLPKLRHSHPFGEHHWQTIVQQSATMWLTYAGLAREQVERIAEPVFVVVGDRDEHVPVEEALRLYRWLPRPELAILPGTAHLRPIMELATFGCAETDFFLRQ